MFHLKFRMWSNITARQILILVLVLALAAWALALGSAAALQAVCASDLQEDILSGAQVSEAAASLQKAATAVRTQVRLGLSGNTAAAQLYLVMAQRDVLSALQVLAKRSATMIPPALQPDDTCSDLYRLPWGAVAVQGAALLMAAAATATRTVRKFSHGCTTLLAVGMALAVLCAHSFYYLRDPDGGLPSRSFNAGKAFFGGCVAMVVTGGLLALALGAVGEQESLYGPGGSPPTVDSTGSLTPCSTTSDSEGGSEQKGHMGMDAVLGTTVV